MNVQICSYIQCYVTYYACILAAFRVTDSELKTLVNELRAADVNKAGSNDIRVNYQAHTFTTDNTDHASRPYVGLHLPGDFCQF